MSHDYLSYFFPVFLVDVEDVLLAVDFFAEGFSVFFADDLPASFFGPFASFLALGSCST
jgi:hypothetical protein